MRSISTLFYLLFSIFCFHLLFSVYWFASYGTLASYDNVRSEVYSILGVRSLFESIQYFRSAIDWWEVFLGGIGRL